MGGSSDYHYRIDLTRSPAEVEARFPLRQRKDFAFLGILGGRAVQNLRISDSQGPRSVRATGEPGIYRVDGLAAGTVEASYDLELTDDCGDGSCRSRDSVVLMGRDVLLFPMGVDPAFHTPCRIYLVMPTEWNLVTPGGTAENSVAKENLQALGETPLLAGVQVTTRTTGGEMLVVQSTGWQLDPEIVGGLVASLLREQETLLGSGTRRGGAHLLRILPQERSGDVVYTPLTPEVAVLELPGDAARAALARSLVEPLSARFGRRLESGLAGATSPATRWWRAGFTEYTTLLAAVRSKAVAETYFLDRLLQAWLNVSSRSDLVGQTTLALAGSVEGDEAAAYVRDGGLLTCFLLDLRIRHATGHASGLGDLLAATRGREVTNDLLRREASRLARSDLTALFARCVDSTDPPPLPDEAAMAGLELVDAGTGEPFIGMVLAEDEPVISRVFETGPAAARGLRAGDRIVAVDGVPMDSAATVEMMLAARAPGDPVEISVSSDGGQIYTAVLDLWERVEPVLRRAERASLSALNAWQNLTHGEATSFAN
jgi:hypothetical protein